MSLIWAEMRIHVLLVIALPPCVRGQHEKINGAI